MVDWIVADVQNFRPARQYALWHDRALFHFMTSEPQRHRYMTALRSALKPGGQVIIAAFAVGGPRRCSGLDTLQCNAERLLQELGPDFELLEQRQDTHVTPGKNDQLFGYYRFKNHS